MSQVKGRQVLQPVRSVVEQASNSEVTVSFKEQESVAQKKGLVVLGWTANKCFGSM